ncbi:hypothetical protein [Streptomyces sp. NPDC057748]|uniref:hypothetical protein n=1 Tax=unclassified Streptomyces TaxID=2593676 RepID=UPI00367BD2C0
MPQPGDLDPYAGARSFYGSELRRLREAAGMPRTESGDKVFCSGTYIGLFEMAERAVPVAVDGLRVSAEAVVAAQALGQCTSENTEQPAVSEYVVGHTSPKSLRR